MLAVNKVYQMDCLKGMKDIDDNSVDLIVTDPPYYIENLKEDMREQTIRQSSRNNIFFNKFDHFKDKNDYVVFIRGLLKEFMRILKPKAQVYMFFSYHHLDWGIQSIKNNGFKFYKPLIWYKPDTMGVFPNQYGCNYEPILWFRKEGDEGKVKLHIGCGQRDVFTVNSTLNTYRKECGYHPTPKPIKIIRQLILNGSDEGDLILDPFMGSGTTAVAAKQTNRNFLGFEKEGDYLKTTYRRLSQEGLMDNLKKYMEEKQNEHGQRNNGRHEEGRNNEAFRSLFNLSE